MNAVDSDAVTPRPAASWPVSSTVWGVVAVLLIVFVLVNVAVAIGADPESRGTDLALQASLAFSLVAVPFAFATRRATPREALAQLGLRRFPLRRGLGLMAATYGVFFVFLVAYGLLVQPEPQETVEVIADETDTLALVALGLLVVVAAPISEEVFFRGFFFGGLRGRVGFAGAAVASAVLFALVHVPSGAAQAPALGVLGLGLAWLYEKTGSLGPPILMHAIQNAIAFSYVVSVS